MILGNPNYKIMKNIKTLLFLLIIICSVNSAKIDAQTPSPSPAPTVENDSEVVKITTSLVQIDVTVTDKRGKVIGDLKPEDFEISENGTKRAITGLKFVNGAKPTDISNNLLSSANSSLAVAPPLTNTEVSRIIAIVVDDLLLSKNSLDYGKVNLIKFINEQVQPTDLVAIIKTSGVFGVLQRFTSDKTRLEKTVNEIKWQPISSIGTSRFQAVGVTFSDQINSSLMGANSTGLNERSLAIAANRTDMERLGESLRTEQGAIGGLQTLKKVVDAMGYLKGRKSLLYISEGVLNYQPGTQSALNSPNLNGISLTNENSIRIGSRDYTVNNFLRLITEAANRNAVSIFTVDPSGTATTSISAEDRTLGAMSERESGNQSDSIVTGRNASIRDAQSNLKYLSRETGGTASVNRNEITNDLTRAFNAQSSYYLISYEPDAETFDPKTSRFNKLEVKVKRQGASVSYRTGFFNVAVDKNSLPGGEQANILKKLMVPYNFSDIGIDLATVYAGTDGKNSTVRSFVNINPATLALTDEADGRKKANVDFLATIFSEDGFAVGSAARNYTLVFDAKSLDNFNKSGLITNFALTVPNPGIYRVKVLVKDQISGKIGTTLQNILVPDSAKQSMSFSGILLQNFTAAEWREAQKIQRANPQKMQTDTAFRHYRKGTVLTYNYGVNFFEAAAKTGDSKLTLTMKLLKDKQPVFTGAPENLPVAAGTKINRGGAFNLGTEMSEGKYTLQISAVTDKSQTVETESIEFELVN